MFLPFRQVGDTQTSVLIGTIRMRQIRVQYSQAVALGCGVCWMLEVVCFLLKLCTDYRGTTDRIGSTGNSHCFRRVASSTTSRVLSVFGPHAGPISLFAEVSWTVRRGIHQITQKPPRIASPISRKRCKAAFRGLLPEPWITSRPL